MLLPARKIAAALAAGCPVISRPASEAPGSCFALGQVLIDAGLPAGVFSILTGDPNPMVGDLISSPIIRKVSLTGSVAVGREILRHCAEGIKKVTMELGGHAPVIVYTDFDPIAAAKKLATTKFRNCGQVCISPSRFYVHHSIIEPFAPVAPITSFDRFEEVIKLANSTPFGLASYLFTHDSALAEQTAQALESGMVGINETLLATAEAPFGGIKESGFGREGGSLGILDYMVPKYIRHHLAKGSVDV